jgi:aspartyl-tRNA(Asn)/glutamyl-tRNA(Gln) amidotransferase subunit A
MTRRELLQIAAAASVGAALPRDTAAQRSSPPVDLATASLADVSELVRTKRASPRELTAACLARIERLNPALNAFITVTAEQATADARTAEAEIAKGRWLGPLHGIPIGLKDLIDTAGVKTTAASALFADRIPTEDAEVVRRLKAAGAVILGKQNMHEFAFGATSVPSHFGPVHNPWNRNVVAGGSSGGSAAAVAASLGYAAIGSDTGGSVRQPAALCGIVGLKATYGRVSSRGVVPLAWSLDHVGPLTRTVLDAAIVLQAIAGYDADDTTSADRPVPDFAAATKKSAASLRVGVPRAYFFDALDPEIAAAIEQALEVVSRLTAGLQDVVVPVSPEVNLTVMTAEAAAFHATRLRDSPQMFQPAVLARLRAGQAVGTASYIERRRELDRMRRSARSLFAKVDVLVTPTMPAQAVRIKDARDDEEGVAVYARNTRPFNVYGVPAISVPCGFTNNGLPIGLQIAAAPWAEDNAIRLAHAYEQATQWHTRRPPVNVS